MNKRSTHRSVHPPARAGLWVAVLLLVLAAGVGGLLWVFLEASKGPGTSSQPQELDMQAAAHRQAILNRLQLAERVLRSVATDVRVKGVDATPLGPAEARYFEALSLVSGRHATTTLFGQASVLPALDDADWTDLSAGLTRVLPAANSGEARAPLLMLLSLNQRGGTDSLLVAELDQNFLWGVADVGLNPVKYCVQNEKGVSVHCASQAAYDAVQSRSQAPMGQSGTSSWQSGATLWQGAQVSLDAGEKPDRLSGWSVLAFAPSSLPASPDSTWTWLAVMATTLLGTFLARRLWVDRPRDAPLPLTPANTPTGEALPPDNRPDLAAMLARQRAVIRAMSDVDRASMSGATRPQLAELVARQLVACSGCELALIGLLDRSLEDTLTVVYASKDRPTTQVDRITRSLATDALLTLPPEGQWFADASEVEPLYLLHFHNIHRAQVIPVYEDGQAMGIVVLGVTAGQTVRADECSNARALAGRLGAALTSAYRTQALYDSTHFDVVTALPNRQFLKVYLAQQLKQARRDQNKLAVLFVNFEGFKKVNSVSGIQGGDQILAEAAARLRTCVRDGDVVTRFEGDEFVIVLSHITAGIDARRVAEHVLQAAQAPFATPETAHHLVCGIGISVFPQDASTPDLLLRHAHCAMFSTREGGSGGFAFFDKEVNKAAISRNQLEHDLRRALSHVELTVVYQPQISLVSGAVVGVEALVRWRLPNGDLISPTEFIPVAERLGLIGEIGEYVMRTACTKFRAWDFQGIAPPRIAINVSSYEIVRTDLFARVERILQETGLRPMHLELEITEGSLLGAQGAGLNTLVRLRNMGVRIAVDDFGTGYSSLNYLQRLPIDVIKIDQSFVRELVSNPDAASIVQAILQVADRLNKSVVVEGIETTQERALLASWGCTTGQGYLWSRPLSAPDFEAFCRAQPAATENLGLSRLG